MASYKLIQDIEAEDHILGPLTFRQFVYGLIAAFFLYLSFIVATKALFLLVVFLPPAIFFSFFAYPFGRDQPTELWALAKIRFLFKPRKRIWDQSNVKDLVTITAPKKIELQLTDGLSQTEVKSRLQALADTIDSRGWIIRNVNNAPSNTNLITPGNNDRLLDISSIPKPVPDYDTNPSDDILDENQSPLSQQLDQMIDKSTEKHHNQLINNLTLTKTPVSQPTNLAQPALIDNATVSSPTEIALSKKLKNLSTSGSLVNANLHVLPSTPPPPTTKPVVSPHKVKSIQKAPDLAIINLSRDNNLFVSTLSSEAKKAKALEDEVIVDLHR